MSNIINITETAGGVVVVDKSATAAATQAAAAANASNVSAVSAAQCSATATAAAVSAAASLALTNNSAPVAIYSTTTALAAAHPTGASGIYLVTADGHWYYWSGSAWTSGGVYQATGIADASVTPRSLDGALSAIFNQQMAEMDCTGTAIYQTATMDHFSAPSSTFTGWCFAFNYSGTAFQVLRLAVKPETACTVKVTVYGANRTTILAVATRYISDLSGATVCFYLPVEINRTLTADTVLYVGIESLGRAIRMPRHINATYNASLQPNTTTYPAAYCTVGDGANVWANASYSTDYIHPIEFFPLSAIVGWMKDNFINTRNIIDATITKPKLNYDLNKIVDTALTLMDCTGTAIYQTATMDHFSAPSSTFTGWCFAFNYSGTAFQVLRLAVKPETACTVKVTVYGANRTTILAVATRYISDLSGATVCFYLPVEINRTLTADTVLYVGIESLGRAIRMPRHINATYNASLQPNTTTYPAAYCTVGDGANVWANAASYSTDYIHPIEFFALSSVGTKNYKIVDPSITQIALPPIIYAVKNRETNVYFDNTIIDDASNYDFNADCDYGQQQQERWTAAPTGLSASTLTISLFDNKSALPLTTATTSVHVADVEAGSGLSKKMLVIGDSTTAAGDITAELLTLFGAHNINMQLLGTKGSGSNQHEGISGWTIAKFYADATSPFVYQSAFNFAHYMSANSYSGVDYVVINLGINDVFQVTDNGLPLVIATCLAQLDAMIVNILAYSASIKIGLCLTIPPCLTQDGFGNFYQTGFTRWQQKKNSVLFVRALISHFQNVSNVYLVPINANIDTANNFPTTLASVNSRNSNSITRITNGVHPANSGYCQIADSIYAWLKNMF